MRYDLLDSQDRLEVNICGKHIAHTTSHTLTRLVSKALKRIKSYSCVLILARGIQEFSPTLVHGLQSYLLKKILAVGKVVKAPINHSKMVNPTTHARLQYWAKHKRLEEVATC